MRGKARGTTLGRRRSSSFTSPALLQSGHIADVLLIVLLDGFPRHMAAARYDQDRLGIVFRASPRQSDVMM